MSEQQFDLLAVQSGEQVALKCDCCGDCCRYVTGEVMLEALDAFRIAQYLGKKDPACNEVGEILTRYTEPKILEEGSGYPIFTIKTVGADCACAFLKDNRCTIQPVKPRACRLYPFTADPGTCGREFNYYLCLDSHARHFCTNNRTDVAGWLRDSFPEEDRRYVREEYRTVAILGKLLRNLPTKRGMEVLSKVLLYKYFSFVTDQPFMPQYIRNNRLLLDAIATLAEHERG